SGHRGEEEGLPRLFYGLNGTIYAGAVAARSGEVNLLLPRGVRWGGRRGVVVLSGVGSTRQSHAPHLSPAAKSRLFSSSAAAVGADFGREQVCLVCEASRACLQRSLQ